LAAFFKTVTVSATLHLKVISFQTIFQKRELTFVQQQQCIYRSDHITPVRRELHWLSIRKLVKFKVTCLVHQSLTTWHPRVRQHLALFAVSWHSDLHDTMHQHSAVTATELLQPLQLACGTLFRSSCAIQTSPTDCVDDSWKDAFWRTANTALC